MPRFHHLNSGVKLCIGLGRDPYDSELTIAQECSTPLAIANTTTPNNPCIVALSDGVTVVHTTGSVFNIANGDGVWAIVPYPAGGYLDSFGRQFPLSAPGPIGPDGAIAIKILNNSYGPWDVLEVGCNATLPIDEQYASGLRWRLTDGDATDIQLLGDRRAIWRESGTGYYLHSKGITVEQPQGEWGMPRIVETPNGFKLLYQSYTGGALVFDGHIVQDGIAFYRPDGIVRGPLYIAWSYEPQEYGVTPPPIAIPLDKIPLLPTIEDRLKPKPPEPEPEPPQRDSKYWLAPNIQTTDVLALFDGDEPNVGKAGVFQLYIQEILNLGNTGPNTYEAFVAKDTFRKLKKHGIALSIECGAVKPGNCQAIDSIAAITEAVKRVKAAGGGITHVSIDEPLVAAGSCPGQPLNKTADYTADFIKATRALGVASVGWIEAWPHVPLERQQTFFRMLVDRGAMPSFWHMDIDWKRAEKEGKSSAAYIAQVTSIAKAYDIKHAVILVSTDDPQPNDAAWYTNVKDLTRRVRSIQNLPRIVVQSWTTRTGGGQTVPMNHGPVGLLASLADAVFIFDGPPPDPKPPIPPKPVIYRKHKEHKPMVDQTGVLWGPGGRMGRPDKANTGPWGHLHQGWRGLVFDGTDKNDERYHFLRPAAQPDALIHKQNNAVIGCDSTINSGGLDSQFYQKPDGNKSQGWAEQWQFYDGNANGAIEAQVEYRLGAGADIHPFFSYPLAFEVIG